MAHSTLVMLAKRLDVDEVLPKHWFVYGLHITPSWMSVFVHFPKFDEDSQIWTFCQVHLADHWLSAPYNRIIDYTNNDFEIFQERWRLAIAIMTILQQVQLLERDLSDPQCATNNPDEQACFERMPDVR